MRPLRITFALLLALTVALPAVAQPPNVNLVTRMAATGWDAAYGVTVDGDYAYVSAGGTGLVIVDVSDVNNPSEVGSFNTTGLAYNCVVVGNYAYVASAGLYILDVSNPASPSQVSFYSTPGTAFEVAVAGNYAYVADFTNGLEIVDITDPQNPSHAATQAVSNKAYGVFLSGSYAYVGDNNSGVRVVDVSTPTSPSIVGTYNSPGKTRQLDVWGGELFIADMNGGLRSIDITTPASPTLDDAYTTTDDVNDVSVVNGYALATRSADGFVVVYVGRPVDIQHEVGDYTTPTTARGIDGDGHYAYVAEGTTLGIYDYSPVTGYNLADGTLRVPAEYATLQAAIKAASNGQTVLVERGTWIGNANFLGKNISVTSQYATTSNAADITYTILDGNNAQNVVAINHGEGGTAELIGFTIRNGTNHGIALLNSSPLIDHCVIHNNSASRGGGIYMRNSSPTISNCTIRDNTASTFGGGICGFNSSNPTISATTIRDNAGSHGGGVALVSSDATITTCVITSNDAPRGAGVYLLSTSPSFNHTEISNNENDGAASDYGAGIYCMASDPSFDYCSVGNNNLNFNNAGAGYGIWLGNGSDAVLTNSIFYDHFDQEVWMRPNNTSNSINVSYTFLYGGQSGINTMGNGSVTWGNGNLGGGFNDDPLFVDPDNGDFTLQAGSPCIDAADPGDPDDPDATRADMGAYYYDQGGFMMGAGSLTAGGGLLPLTTRLDVAFPNPFNAEVHIPFALAERGAVEIAVFDLTGRKVATLVNGYRPAGFHTANWDGLSAASGLYLVRMHTAGFNGVRRVTLVK